MQPHRLIFICSRWLVDSILNSSTKQSHVTQSTYPTFLWLPNQKLDCKKLVFLRHILQSPLESAVNVHYLCLTYSLRGGGGAEESCFLVLTYRYILVSSAYYQLIIVPSGKLLQEGSFFFKQVTTNIFSLSLYRETQSFVYSALLTKTLCIFKV